MPDKKTLLKDKLRIISILLFFAFIGAGISLQGSFSIELTTDKTLYCEGDNIIISGYSPGDGVVYIIDNTSASINVSSGNFSFAFVSPVADNYTITLVSGNSSVTMNVSVVKCYNSSKNESYIIFDNKTLCIDTNVAEVKGRAVIDSMPYTGDVNISVGGTNYVAISTNGSFSVTFVPESEGEINVSAAIENLSNSTVLYVKECNTVSVSTDKDVYCSNESVLVSGYAKIGGENYTGEGILVMKNGRREEARVMLINGLLPTYGFVNPSPDNYTVVLNVSGVVAEKNITIKSCENFSLPAVNVSVTPENITRNFTAKENLSVQILGKNEFCDNESVRLEIKALLGDNPYTGEGSIKINSTVYSVFFENGTYAFSQNLSLGVYLVNASVNETFDYRVIAVRACANETFVNATVSENTTARNETVNVTQNVTANVTQGMGESYLLLEIAKKYYEGEQIALSGIAVINGTNYTGFVNVNISGKSVEYVSVAEARNGLFSLSLPMLSAGNYTIVAKAGEVSNFTEIEVVKRILSRKSVTTDFGDITLESEKGNMETLAYEKGKLFLRITNLTKGERVKVRLILPFQIPQDYHLYFWKKVGSETKEIDYEILDDRRTVVLELEDGKLDEDNMANGIIVDPLLLPKPPAFQSKVLRKTPNTLEISVTEKSSSKQLEVQSSKGSLDVKIVDPKNIPSVPKGTNFKFKLMKINISSLSPGDSVDVYIRFSEPVSSIAEFWKFSASNLIWYRYPFERIDKYTIKITLQDGGKGDEDGVANGIILDDAGLSDSWWNTSWLYRKEINLTSTSSQNITNFPAHLIIDTQSLIAQGKMQSDCADIRFTWWNLSSGQEEKTDYLLVGPCNTTRTLVWVKVPVLYNGSYVTTVLMYYGNNQSVSESNSSAVFPGIRAYWAFEEGSGNVVNDYSGNSYTGELTDVAGGDAPLWRDSTSCKIGYCIESDDTGDAVNLSYSAINGLDNVTFEAWVKTIDDTWGLISGAGSTSDNEYLIYRDGTTGELRLYSKGSFDGAVSSTIIDGNWHHLAVVRNSDGTGAIYIDGNLLTTLSALTTGVLSISPNGLWLLQEQDSVGGTWDTTQAYIGLVDDIRVYSVSLSQAEIQKRSISYSTALGEEEYVGKLNATITAPSEGFVATRYSSFWLNGTVFCERGNCGDVNAYAQYIAPSGIADRISEDTQDEFLNYSEKVNVTLGDLLKLKPVSSLSWLNESWPYRKEINLTYNGLGNLSEYVVNVTVDTQSLILAGKMKGDCSDIVFSYFNETAGNEIEIPYWIESNCNTSTTQIWVRVPFIRNATYGADKIYMYYGNPSASIYYDPEDVFDYFVNFTKLGVQSAYGSGQDVTPSQYEIVNNTALHMWGNNWKGVYYGPISISGDGTQILELYMNGTNTAEIYGVGFDANLDNVADAQTSTYQFAGSQAWGVLPDKNYTSFGSWEYVYAILNDFSGQYLYFIFANDDDADSNGDVWYKNVRIRKYASPEPSISVGGEEALDLTPSGYYVSQVFDFGTEDVQLNRIYWKAETNVNTSVNVYTRTSSDGVAWSVWYLETNDTVVDAPSQRYFQYKVELSSTNNKETPYFDSIVVEYTYTTPAFVTMQSSGTDFTTSNPYSCGYLNESFQVCYPNWQVTPRERGNYTIRIWTNSSNTNTTPGQSQWINVSVYEQTYIANVVIEPSVQYKGGDVTISAQLLDALSNPIANANVTFKDETDGNIIGYDVTDSQGYAAVTYTIPDTATLGYHTINVSYPQNDTLFYFGSWGTAQLKVSSSPKFHSILLSDKNLGTKERERIQVNVTDEVGLDKVLLYLTYPNGTEVTLEMSYNATTGYYEYTTEELWQAEDYYFYVWANNTDGISNSSWQETFAVKIIGRLDIAVEKDEYKNFELVRLGTVSDEWDFVNYTWRDVIYVYSNDSERYLPVNFYVNTSKIISEGKLNTNCSDIRFVQIMSVEELPIAISNPYGEVKYDLAFPITITDKETLSKMSSDGRDVRIFSYQTSTPYASEPDIPFWVESVSTNEADIWIRLSQLPLNGLTIYLYYGNTSAESKSNYTAVFTDIVGEAGVIYHNDTWVDFSYLNSSSDVRFVFSSIDSYYGAQEAFTRITKINRTGFHVFIQESIGLDQSHAYENIGWLAVRNGTWIVAGKLWQVGNLSLTGSYSSVTFYKSYSTEPAVISQIQSFVDTTPAKTRMDNPGTGSISIKVEPGGTSDTFTSNENTAWLTAEAGIYQAGALIEVGKKYHNQPVDVSSTGGWTSYTLTAGFTSTPAVVAKLMTENGGDNTHERIRNVGTTGFEYAMEEEYGHDGPHTYEWNGYFAVEPGKPIYGTKYYDTWPATTEQTHERRIVKTITTELPYWIESGCGSENTSIWVQLSYVSPGKTTIYMYHGNPSDGVVNNTAEDEIRVFTMDKTASYVVLGVQGSNLDVASYGDNNEITLGSTTATLNAQGTYTFSSSDVSLGNLLYSESPVSSGTESAGDGAPLTPLAFKGKLFVFPVTRYSTLYLDFYAVEDAQVQVWVSDPAGNPWSLNDSFTLSQGSATSKSYAGSPDTDAGIELTYMINSTGDIVVFARQSNDDYLPLVPADTELYLEPSNYLELAAIEDGTSVTIYYSDGTSATVNLNAGQGYTSAALGSDGAAPGARIVSNKPVFAYQLADSDGTEATPALPLELMDKVFVFPQDAEYFVAVTPAGSVTECTLYTSTGAVRAGPWTAAPTGSSPGKIGYGTAQDGTTYIFAGDKLVCNNSVYVYYEEAINDAETLLYGAKLHRKFVDTTYEFAYEEDKWVDLENNGNEILRGYLWAIVQKWDPVTGTWNDLPPAVINDRATNTLREIAPGGALNLTQLWLDYGAWNTSDRENGHYRVYFAFVDPEGNTIYDYELRYLTDNAHFHIVPANISLVNLTHNALAEYGIEEYETGDAIKWINLTIKAYNNSAINTNVYLTLLDSANSYAGFGPENENYYCGLVYENTYCTAVFDNSTSGYPISENLGITNSANYVFKVNVTMKNGDDYINTSYGITVHNIPSTFSATLSPTRIYQNGDPAYYNFSFQNLWSRNITNASVKINCPNIVGFTCECLSNPGSSVCDLGNVTQGAVVNVSFRISATEDVPQGDYIINVTVNYTNPLGNKKSWKEVEGRTLEVRSPGILEITPYSYPTSVTRGESAGFEAYANNTGSLTANQAWLAYSAYPSGWSITQGQENVTTTNLAPAQIFWNNVTFTLSINSALGAQQVKLESGSDIDQRDFKYVTVYVYANTSLQIWVNDTNVSRGEGVRVYAKLLFDNSSAISGQNISFYDETDNLYLGWAVTDGSGIAYVDYAITDSTSLGLHILNASFSGNNAAYLNPSQNETQIDVGLKPFINSIEFLPSQVIGYGVNATVRANVTDDQGLDFVEIKITSPSGSVETGNMTLVSGDIYEYNYTNTWINGTYTVEVIAHDIVGSANSSTDYFEVKIYGGVVVKTEKAQYYPAETVKLAQAPVYPYLYKREINISNSLNINLTEYQINILVNTSELILEGKMQSDCDDLRFTWMNRSSGKEQEIPYYLDYGCDAQNILTNIWMKVPIIYANSNTTIHMYYGNDQAQSASNETAVFSYTKNETTFYVVSFVSANSPLDVIAFEDGTNVVFNGVAVNLNKGSTYQFTAGGSAALGVAHDKPIYGAFTNDVTDALSPISWAGKSFVYRVYRGTNEWYIYAPFGGAEVNITDSSTGATTTVYIANGTAYNASVDITDGSSTGTTNAVIIESNVSILVQHAAPAESYDSRVLYPANTELYGVPSQYLEVAAIEDGTTVNVYCSDGSTYSWNLNRGESAIVGGFGSEGTAAACVVKANKPVGANQLADSDGTETTTFLPLKELERVYYLPQGTQYVAIAAPFSTTCNLYNPDGTLANTQSASPNGNAPGKIFFGSTTDGTNIQIGSWIECTQPVFAYYEYSGTAGGDETNLFGMKANRKYAGIELNYTIGEETPSGSAVLNFGHEFKGYIIVEIQKNVSGSWQHKATLLNDSATNTLRDFTSSIFDISSLASTWNPEGETGEYRVVAYVVNPDQSVLNASKRKMLGTYEFNVVPVPLKLNISEIRVYEAPNNEHGGGTLIDSGANKTFNLEVGKTYRFEIDVSVLGDSHVWNISEANVTFENLNQSWIIDTQNHVWYLNATDSVERLGGVFSGGTLKWNTSENNGLGENGTVVTFYFIVNFTGAIPEERGTVFQIRGTDYIYRDFDTIKLYIADTTPPKLWQEIYGTNTTEILRGDAIKVFARWDEEISQALAEYNSTTSLLINYSISLPSPNPENWTNYTIETTSLWLLGRHVAKIYASDIAGNWNGTLPYLYFDVYGLAYVESIYVNDTSPTLNDYIEISCLVKDDTNTEIIENYNVTFWYDNAYIGYALTNASGYATFVYQVMQPGEHVIKCNITNSSEMYYKIDSRNFKEQTIFVSELEAPKWHEISSPSLAHKGDYVMLAVNWTDNFALQAAKLATNASGSYQNVSELALSGTDAWANFTYQIPVSMQPGYLAWKQFANDTSGNENVTQEQIIEVWGWAKVDQAFVEPGSIQLGNSTIMYCHVVDANYTSYNIEGYTVSFYLGTAFLGSNTTNASGWAQYNFTPSQAGVFTVKCNISDYPAKKYNASELNEGSDTLTVTQTADVTPPKIVNGNYGLNATSIYRYDAVLIYGQWNEEIDIGWVEFNTSQPDVFTTVYFQDSGVPGNWTNYTMSTDDTWKPGVHVAKLYANDTSGNINDTLDYLSFEMWGRSAVYWIQPTQPVYRGEMTIICQVRDYDTGEGIQGYTVEFYDSTTYLGSNSTNSTGYAQFTVDTTSYTPGIETFYCKIIDDSSKYYSAVVTQASYDVEIRGKLNVTIITPQTNAILERGLSYWLNSSTVDELGNSVVPDTANWYDNGQSIGTGENISWSVPLSHALGTTTLKVNVTKAYYDSDEDLRNVYIYGHAKAKWISPNNGSYPQGTSLTLECFVNDSDVNSGIANYPVNFYYNGTLIANALSNASGYAEVTWNTAGLQGTYNVSCAIEDNSTLYYLASQPLDNTFIEIYVDTTPPTVTIISPENKSYATTSVNLNYTATDDRSLEQCWYSLDGGSNVSLPNCENTTLTGLADGSHHVIVYANDSAGNVGYAEQFFTVDTQAPVITIVSPENKTYAQSWVWGNVSLNEKASLCWYSLDGGSNVSMQNTTPDADYWYANVSSLSEDAHEIAFYCNDTAGNENATSVVFTVDMTSPSVYLLEPVDNAVLNTDYIKFVCNASDSIALVNVSLLTNESGTLSIVQTNTSGVNGNYTFSRSVQDGAYLWTCKACDAVHCVFAGENRTVVADTQVPNITIYSPQNTSYATSDVDLNYTASDLTLQNCWYSLDGGSNISLPNCENTTLTSLSDGSHKVRVYANDSLGRENFDEVYFTVDTTPPQVTVVSPVNNTEYATNIVELNYTASDNLALTWCGYSLDSQPNVTLVNCENTTLTGLSNEIHNVTVYVRDIAGNENASFVNFSVNSVAPVVNIIYPEDFAYYASSTVNLNYTASDADLDQCWYSLDNGANVTLPNCENTTLTSLSDGSHKVRVYANDSQAHESYDEVTFYVDTAAPSVTIISPENVTYNSSSVWLNYTASDANLEQCWYSLDGGSNVSLPNCENTTLTGLADGSHHVIVYANDSAGNVGYAEQFFTVDTQAPVITIVSPQDGATYLTNTVNVNYTVTDNLGVDTCWYKLDGGENVYLTNCENFTLVNLVDGTHSLVIYANDTGRNVNSSGVSFTIDTQGPVITFVAPTPDDNQALDYNWTYVNITTNEDASIAFLEWNYTNGTVVNYTMNTLTSRSFWFNVTDLEDGTYYYRVYANDSYNHWGVSELRSVRISTTAPVIDILSPKPKTYSTTNYIPLEVVSNKPIDTWWFSINGKANETFTPNTSIAAKPGTNELYVYGNDTAGRIGWSSISFTVNATLWQDYFATKSGINQSENASVSNKLSIDFCWYIEGKCYLYRKPMIINNSQTLTDFQVNLTVDTQSLISADKMNATCKDIRFTLVNASGEYEIPYYLESGCNTTQTKIWIRLPEISTGNTTVYMYYGNMLVESESNSSEVFDSYSASQTCSGSTAGGTCPMAFNAPVGYEFYLGNVDLEAAGDLGFGGAYADSATCAAGETYERFNVTVEGSCYGVYSPGIDGCTLTHISTWPKDVSQDIRGKTSFTVTPQVNSKVNADPATCGFYYYFRANLSAEIRKQGYVDNVFEEVEESRKHNAWVKTILIKPLKLGRWEGFSASHVLNNGNVTYEIYNWNNVLLVNCTSSPANCDLSGITSDSIYVKIGLFTTVPLNGPEVYNINVTWNTSTPVVIKSYNSSYQVNPNTRIEIYDKNNNLAASGYGSITADLEIYENYTYKSFTPVSDGLETSVYNLNITNRNLQIEEQVVENYAGFLPSNVSAITPIYALNDTGLDFEKAKLIIPKNGVNVQNVLHCVAWDFANANCSQWEFMDPATLEGYGENATHIWFNVTSFEAFAGASTQPDLVANNIMFNISQDNIVENQVLLITANISEEAGVDAINVTVRLDVYNFNGSAWVLKQTNESVVNISANTYELVNFTWIAKPGTWNFSVTVDPANEISETNESNNFNSTTYNVSGWVIYYGHTNGWLAIKDSAGNNFSVWIPLTQQGNLYFTDYDSDYAFTDLMPLNGTNDLAEADQALNMTGFSDSIKALYDKNNDGVADSTACFEIGSRTVCDVPVINSTDSNNGNFITGILWNSGDGGTEYNGTQDLVFITKVNSNILGSYGTYDYEARIPALLRALKGTNDLIKIFMEVK